MLPAGGEIEQHCADKMLTEDVYISAIRPIHPLGTHHTTLSVSASATACSTLEVLQSGIIYAAGVGTEVLRMPPGVAMKLSAGHVLRLGLHLYNVTSQPLSGVSGIEVIRVDREDVEHEAELMLAGPLRFSIDPGLQTITHDCVIREAQTVFAIFPHMHQLGVHLKTTAVVGGAEPGPARRRVRLRGAVPLPAGTARAVRRRHDHDRVHVSERHRRRSSDSARAPTPRCASASSSATRPPATASAPGSEPACSVERLGRI